MVTRGTRRPPARRGSSASRISYSAVSSAPMFTSTCVNPLASAARRASPVRAIIVERLGPDGRRQEEGYELLIDQRFTRRCPRGESLDLPGGPAGRRATACVLDLVHIEPKARHGVSSPGYRRALISALRARGQTHLAR